MRRYIFILLIPLFVGCNQSDKQDVETTKVKRGMFVLDVTEEGEVDATRAINISSPSLSWRFGMLKIDMIIEEGTIVKAGDTVIMFDQAEVIKAKMDKESELEIARADLEKLKASQQSKINELEANLKVTEISHKISEIYFEQSVYDADITRKEIKLDLEKARITLDRARSEIINQKQIHSQEEQQAMLRIRQLEAEVQEAQSTLMI
jgi:HlyD family secretion protein